MLDYLARIKRTYITGSFAFTSYNPPNTMFEIKNDLPDLLLTLEPMALRLYLKCLTLLKRNHEPTLAITILLSHKVAADIMTRSTYYIALKQLIALGLLVKTPAQGIFIICPTYATKLFKPKLDIIE